MTNTPETQADAFYRRLATSPEAMMEFEGTAMQVGENLVFDFPDDSVLVVDDLGNRVGVH